MESIVLDRTTLGRYADCPYQGYVMWLLEIIRAEIEKKQIFEWEKKRFAAADPELIKKLRAVAEQSTDSVLADVGKQIHDLTHRAFEECKDKDFIADWFLEELPKLRPDTQPQAIVAARHICDKIANFHIPVIGVESQLEYELYPATKTRPAVIVTMRYDIYGQGLNISLHVLDWKTGFKRRTNSETRDSFQARFGSWLLWQQTEYADIETVHFWYFETRFGTQTYAQFRRSEEHPRLPHLTTEKGIRSQVVAATRLFLKNSHECWPQPQKCAWCDVIRFCPKAHIEAKEISDDPKAFIDKLIVLTETVKLMKKTATAWVKAKGAIEGSKVVFDRKRPAEEKFTCDFLANKPKGPAKTGDDNLDSHFKKK